MTARARLVIRGAVLGMVMAVAMQGAAAHAQELDGTLKKIKTSGTFTIGYRESSRPFSFIGPDKRPAGYSIDLCLEIAQAVQKAVGVADLKLAWVPVTPETRLPAVAKGTVDIECGSTTMTLSRQEQVDFSLPTFVDGGGLLVKKEQNVAGPADLAGKRIGVAAGTTTEKALAEYLKREFVSAQTVTVKDHGEGMAALERGTIDAYASDRGILIGLALGSADYKQYGLSTTAFSYEPYALPLRRNDAAFRLVVNRALAALYRSSRIVNIYDRWFGAFGKPGIAIQAMYQLNGLPE
jgi:glutamate/aspartate transport system substrate-binding protein